MDRIFAGIALLCLFGFTGILVWSVPEVDLTIVVLLVLGMAVYEFWTSLRQSNNNNGS